MSQKKKLHIPEFFSKLKFGFLSGPVKPSERIKELCFIEATITVTNASLSSSVSAGVYKFLFYTKTYLIFVTDTTDGVCVKKLPGVNFYRFNAKNWQFTV